MPNSHDYDYGKYKGVWEMGGVQWYVWSLPGYEFKAEAKIDKYGTVRGTGTSHLEEVAEYRVREVDAEGAGE